MLRGLGVTAVAALLPGCMPGSNVSSGSSKACGSNLCIDLTDPANKDLTTVGGALLFDTSQDTIIVVRTSETAVIALSAICTHTGCTVDWSAGQQLINCPCHGSQFDESGQVVRGPARRPLHSYSASLANQTITVVA